MIQGALKTLHLPDIIMRLSLTFAKIGTACYLVSDNIIWASKVGLVKMDTKKWSESAARFWLFSLCMVLIRDFYEVYKVLAMAMLRRKNLAKKSRHSSGNGDTHDKSSKGRPVESHVALVTRCVVENKPLFVDTLKNLCDFPLPMCSLQMLNLSPGTQGILGVISSICGASVVWNPMLKLVPS